MENSPLQPHLWKDDYVVNIKSIDNHNQKLFDVLNLIIESINQKNCRENMADIFFRLTYYTENYFTDEEIFLQQNNYPNFAQHKEAHNQFINRIIRFHEDDLHIKSEEVCREMVKFLEDWFEMHLLKQDKEAVKFLIEKGIK